MGVLKGGPENTKLKNKFAWKYRIKNKILWKYRIKNYLFLPWIDNCRTVQHITWNIFFFNENFSHENTELVKYKNTEFLKIQNNQKNFSKILNKECIKNTKLKNKNSWKYRIKNKKSLNILNKNNPWGPPVDPSCGQLYSSNFIFLLFLCCTVVVRSINFPMSHAVKNSPHISLAQTISSIHCYSNTLVMNQTKTNSA